MHEVENRLQAQHPQFRIAQTVNQAGRVLNVRKQNGEPLALSALGVQRPQDMLPRLIGLFGGYRLQGRTASPAKAGCRPIEVTTGAALNSEGSPASFAILIGRLVLATATQTLHLRPLGEQR